MPPAPSVETDSTQGPGPPIPPPSMRRLQCSCVGVTPVSFIPNGPVMRSWSRSTYGLPAAVESASASRSKPTLEYAASLPGSHSSLYFASQSQRCCFVGQVKAFMLGGTSPISRGKPAEWVARSRSVISRCPNEGTVAPPAYIFSGSVRCALPSSDKLASSSPVNVLVIEP